MKLRKNFFTGRGVPNARAAEAARNMAPCSKTEAIERVANNYDVRGIVFEMAVKAGLVCYDRDTRTWQGVHEAHRLSAMEDAAETERGQRADARAGRSGASGEVRERAEGSPPPLRFFPVPSHFAPLAPRYSPSSD